LNKIVTEIDQELIVNKDDEHVSVKTIENGNFID